MNYITKINEMEMQVAELKCYLHNYPEDPLNWKRLQKLQYLQRELITYEEIQILNLIS